jgi:pimeloyl-ACP methyl ester carboxylesterase
MAEKKKTKLEEFQTSDGDRQLELLATDEETAAAAAAWLGLDAVKELRKLWGGQHQGSVGARNLIVVPGVMGSALQSEGFGGVWWLDLVFSRDKLDQIALAAGGQNDINPGYEIQPCAIDVSYAPLRQALAKSPNLGGTVQFPYDWRKPLSASNKLLRNLILQTYDDYGKKVNLVGHSMGGLMIRSALIEYGAELWPKVEKIVFIATPHYGSPSIAGYLKNHLWGWEQVAVLGAFLSRETFRSLWGVLSLLPAPKGVYPGTRNGEDHPCANFDMYKADEWKLPLSAAEALDLQNALDTAANFHRDLYDSHAKHLDPVNKQKMLQICGVGYKSLFRLEVKKGWLGLWEDIDKITSRVEGDPNREGDGRVPLASAQLEDIEWRYIKGVHGSVQNIPAVAQEVLAWIDSKPLTLDTKPKDALSRHLAGGGESAAPHLDGSETISLLDDEYDRYREIGEREIAQLVADLKAGKIPNANQVRIL